MTMADLKAEHSVSTSRPDAAPGAGTPTIVVSGLPEPHPGTAMRSPAYGFPYLPFGGEILDRLVHAWQGRFTLSISPSAVMLAFADWAMHLGNAPGKQAVLADKAVRKLVRLMVYAGAAAIDRDTPPCIEPLPGDRRFTHPDWRQFPYAFYAQSFLLAQQWVHNATTGIPGLSQADARIVPFVARQILDVVAPSNNPFTNPETLRATVATGGMNFAYGMANWTEDALRLMTGRRAKGLDAFQVGRDMAATPGSVVFRNELIELIQYAPSTATVHAEPVLIVPAWIMKYYILDLSPENSLVRYLVGRGFTVFAISWRNPGPELRDYGLDEYRRLGVMAALDAIGAICGAGREPPPVHACGYCLGGTLLTIAAAAMARDGDRRLKTLTLLAAQTDFTEAGELMLFINESQVAYLEDIMWEAGYLDTTQMSGAFQMLRSNDLIWSQMVQEYLRGRRPEVTDLMAWNADGTRLPYRMHSEYMHQLLLGNDLSEGRYKVDGRPAVLSDIRAPIFAVGTRRDHVAPWRSVYKIHLQSDTTIVFLLTDGGHNAGIVAGPDRPDRNYRMSERGPDDRYVDPDLWLESTPASTGSWWRPWADWLERQSLDADPITARPVGSVEGGFVPLCPAPGHYVLER
ncbi:PHA/PHB synthase family protein [Azospirillum endophyticum]